MGVVFKSGCASYMKLQLSCISGAYTSLDVRTPEMRVTPDGKSGLISHLTDCVSELKQLLNMTIILLKVNC